MDIISFPLFLISSLTILLLFLFGLAACQYVYLFILKRWTLNVRLPDPSGYSLKQSIRFGDSLDFYIHTTKPALLEIYRLGTTLEKIDFIQQIKTERQPEDFTPWEGLRWKPNFRFNSEILRPGFYFAKISHKNNPESSFRIPFIVNSDKVEPLCVVASTNTWQAYNDFGGKSFYKDFITPYPLKLFILLFQYLNFRCKIGSRHHFPITPLSFARPNLRVNRDLKDLENKRNTCFSHLIRGEWNLIRFLEINELTYNLVTDYDFAYTSFHQTKSFLFNTHSEYWSQEMTGRLSQYMNEGKKILFLSGNNIYREVQFLNDSIAVIKEETDAIEISKLIGTSYNALGFLTSAGYKINRPEHWIFKDLNLNQDETIGQGNSPMSTKHIKYSRHNYGDEIDFPKGIYGASGYETDKITGASSEFTVLATGENPEGPASMVYRDLPHGGWLFNVGSVSFTQTLENDKTIQSLLLNLIRNIIK